MVDPEIESTIRNYKANRLSKLDHRRTVLIAYMKTAIDEQDWHGVSDAANDIREVDAEIRGING